MFLPLGVQMVPVSAWPVPGVTGHYHYRRERGQNLKRFLAKSLPSPERLGPV